jgi:arginine/ornithine N-succinyltransferase beta subunit
MLLSNDKFAEFRTASGRVRCEKDGEIIISPRLTARLQVNIGDLVRVIAI